MPRKTTAAEAASVGGDSKSARTRTRLLDATAKVLARKGFAGTRLSDIAEEANVQSPAIYYYYASREDLVEDVLFVGAQAMFDYVTEALAALPEGTSPSVRLETAVEAHLRHALELSDYARAVIRNANQVPEQFSRRAFEAIGQYTEIWRRLIADLDEAGLLRADVDRSVGRMLVLGSLYWTVEWWDAQRGPLDVVISVAQSMVLHALRP